MEDAKRKFEEDNFCQLRKIQAKTLVAQGIRYPKRIEGANTNLKYFSIKLSCLFSGDPKRKPRANIKRIISSFRQGCPFEISFLLSRNGQSLKVTRGVFSHNHVLSSYIYHQLPRQRIVRGKYREEIKTILHLKANHQLIQTKIQKDTGCLMSKNDISNLKAENRRAIRNEMDSVISFLKQQKGSSVEIVKDDKQRFKCLFYQDKQMKRVYNLFPEFLMVDATHKHLHSKLPVYSLFVVDGNGVSEIVAFFIITNDTKSLMEMALNVFKNKNPSWDSTLVIISGFEERNVISSCFPYALIQINYHDVLSNFSQEVTAEKIGVSTDEIDKCLQLLTKIANSKKLQEYDLYVNELKATEIEHLIMYFEENWEEIKDEWVTGLKKTKFNIGENTNERLVIIKDKIGKACTQYATLKKFSFEFISLIDVLRNEKKSIEMVLKVDVSDSITEIVDYFDHITHFAFEQITNQNNLSRHVKMSKAYYERESVIYSNENMDIMASSHGCSCSFIKQFGLPCCHVLRVRYLEGMSKFDMTLISQRWTLTYCQEKYGEEDSDDKTGVVTESEYNGDDFAGEYLVSSGSKRKGMSETEKYKKALKVAHELASVACEGSLHVFNERIALMKNILSVWNPPSNKVSQPSSSSFLTPEPLKSSKAKTIMKIVKIPKS